MSVFNKNCILRTVSVCLISFLPLAFADTTHVVEKGETLYSIGRKYEITVPEIRAANNMKENDVLKAGQKLVIPTADIENAALLSSKGKKSSSDAEYDTYVAEKGDTYYGIARKFDIKVAELFAINGLGENNVLKVGQKLKVPSKNQSVAQTPQDVVVPDLKNNDPRKYSDATAAAQKLAWPVKNPKITYVNGKVSGVQLSCSDNEDIKTIMAGTVMFCGPYRGFGNVVFVQSKTGLIYAYTGLSTIKVKKGEYAVYGDVLGKAGVDAISKESQLTLMVFRNGSTIDPAKAPRG